MNDAKEDVLKKYFRLAQGSAYAKVEEYRNIIGAAMDEYAEIRSIGFKKFCDHYMNHAPIGEVPCDEKLYQKYLESLK